MSHIQTLVQTLEIQSKTKKDYLTPTSSLSMVGGQLVIGKSSGDIIYKPTSLFHSQVAGALNIPKGYYDRMKTGGIELLDSSVNHWLRAEDKTQLIRTFESGENTARAFLSDSYSIMDNMEILMEALDAIKKTGIRVVIEAAELSETSMYLKITCPDVEVKGGEILSRYNPVTPRGVGDGVISGFVLTNSEVGKGAFKIQPRAVVKVCGNGLIRTDMALKSVHLGGKMDELEMMKNDGVRRANMRLIKEQVKHAVTVFLSKDYLTKLVNIYNTLGSQKLEAPIPAVVEVIGKEYGLGAERKNSILNYFMDNGGDRRRIGVINAITEELQQYKDADLKHESEVMSYEILKNFDSIESKAFKVKFTNN